MQKETLWPRQVCATNRKCSDRSEESGTWDREATKECFVCGINFDICHGTTSVTDRVHVKWKSFSFFFFLLWHIFFWPESAGIYIYIFLINNFLGKTLLFCFKLPLPRPPAPRSHHFPNGPSFKRRLRTNLYLHSRGSDYKHNVAFIKWN